MGKNTNTNKGDNMSNPITDEWVECELTCVSCKGTFTELADPHRVARHWRGENVQDVWAEAGDDYREFMISLRAKHTMNMDHWLCGAKYSNCWEKFFSEDEED